VSLCKREGISEAKTLVSVLVEVALQLLAAVLLLGIALLAVPRSSVPGPVYLFLLLAPLCFVAIYPPILNWALRLVLRRLKRPGFELELSYGRMAWITGTYLADWTIQGIGCFILINSFYPLPLAKLPVMLGGYAISWMIGFLALVAPAGLGIREGIFSVILKMVMAAPVAIMSVLITRIWMSVSETAMATVCLPIVSRRGRNNEANKTPEA